MGKNDPFNLNEIGEWSGEWWLPHDPDNRLPGILKYDGKGNLSLSLIGAFEDRIVSNPAPGVYAYHEGSQTWDVMHGVAENREITLLDVYPVNSTRTIGAWVKSPDCQTATVSIAVIGARVTSKEEPGFEAVRVSIEDLTLWANSSVFKRKMGTPEDTFDGTGSISVTTVKTESVDVRGTEYQLVHEHTLPNFDQRRGETVGLMRDKVFIRVVPAEPFTLNDVLKETNKLQDLISLAMHRAAGVNWLQLEVAVATEVLPNEQVMHQFANVLYSPAALGQHDAKAINPDDVFFTCGSLPFEQVLPRWCVIYSSLQASINMILGLRYAPARYIESNLLTAAGAAEALHRGLGIGEKPFPAADFKAMRDAMLAQVPEKYREKFKAAIRNDLTLRDRLVALAERPDQEAVSSLVPDIEQWARKTTRARNDLAHEGNTPRHTIDELIAIVSVTTAIVTLNLLHELGLPPEQQRTIVRENPRLGTVTRMAKQWLVDQSVDK